MIKKIVIILLLIFSFYSISNANNDYYYNFVCDNSSCLNTTHDIVSDNYYMYPIEKTKIDNFSNFINDRLNSYADYYWYTKIEINWYCDWSCDELQNKKITLSELLTINTEFKIGKKKFFWFFNNEITATYDSWKDYLLSNFSDIIYNLHSWFPLWDLKPYLSDILYNILSYDDVNNQFLVKNLCKTVLCTESNKKNIQLIDEKPYYFIKWKIKQSSFFKDDTFKVSDNYNISKLVIQAWESVNFNFWFEDYLNQFWNKTDYEYKIYYNYEGEPIPNDLSTPFLTEKLSIDWSNFKVISENKNAWDLYELNILDENDKKIRLWIKEWIKLTKSWKVSFYLAVKNTTSWDKFNIKIVNDVAVTVLPNDSIKTSNSSLYPFTKIANSTWFNQDSPFDVELSLFDEFWNIHYDEIIWYDILLSDWSSPDIQLAVWDWLFSDKILWLTTINNKIKFKLRVREPGYHTFNWFDITVKTKLDNNNYLNPFKYNTIKNIVPENMYDWTYKMDIHIKEPVKSELVWIKCWKTVTINFNCTRDIWVSWCNIIKNTKNTYTSETENNTKWYLTIQDNAYNTREYEYTMNHVDTTAPTINLSKSTNILNWTDYYYLANSDKFNIKLFEESTSSCTGSINYEIKSLTPSPTIIKSWKLTWPSNFFNKVDNTITLEDIFTKSWIYNLEISAWDEYWNKTIKNLKYTIYPNKVSEKESTFSLYNDLDREQKYWNNFDIYEYKLILRDQFKNLVNNKSILSFNTNCDWITWCTNLKTTSLATWVDAIHEEYDNTSDNNWFINFKLKSLAPWNFKEVFKVELPDWDNKYVNTTTKTKYTIWNFSSTNSFKKPVKWDISIVAGWTKPEIWKLQNYNIWLTELSWNLAFSAWNLDIRESTVKDITAWHYWQKFNEINSNFWNNINTIMWFSWQIDVDDNILSWANVTTKNMLISYILDSHLVQYFLDDFWITWCNTSTLWLKIKWNIQWDWKSGITWQNTNFTDISKLDLRTKIRANWFKLVKSMKNWQILNWVKYVEWDIELSWNISWYETLVVYNWNVKISNDLNTIWKKLWIIVLKDKYVVSIWKTKWNIYVNKDVRKINAIIYADWWFISADTNWDKYSDLELVNKLELNWTLFTRNTVWWAVRANTTYLLPGWEKTNNYLLAEKYDLNYIRKSNLCDLNSYSFLINYDSKIQLNPPKWFEN